QVARDITDPKTGKSVLEAELEHRSEMRHERGRPAAQQAATPDTTNRTARTAASLDTAFSIGALGSGSDYTAFLDFVGVPSLNASYGGGGHDGIYHSIYDSFDFYTRFMDPTFAYGVAEAQTTGTAVLRLADAPVLPFEFETAARTYRRYADEIAREAKRNDATKSLDLSDVLHAIDHLQQAGERYESVFAGVDRLSDAQLREHAAHIDQVNAILYGTEHALTDSTGLEHREWFKHLIYAPGFYTGYGVKTMPGIREAVEDKPDGEVAQREAARVAAAIDRMATQVDSAADVLAKVTGGGAVGQ
ncbi:MAG TPA: transferrin receptor-like dimerization domain-containing protein, partial [Gemmatimonadaceae bacterium]|nr:transferrin receptor-like dimerization domain-containing protein [Gemmatimonadaceae bacterium]